MAAPLDLSFTFLRSPNAKGRHGTLLLLPPKPLKLSDTSLGYMHHSVHSIELAARMHACASMAASWPHSLGSQPP